jgi:autotransporter-associated beta strand protein
LNSAATVGVGASQTLTLGGIITNTGALTKAGTGTLTLTNANTFSGGTAVSAGTLALGSSGSLNASSSISIAAGATFDVSGLGASVTYTLGSGATLTGSGTASAATIKGGSSGTVSLGSQGVTLNFDGSDTPLTVSQGILSLSGNIFTVVTASALAPGIYTLVSTPNNISGTVNSVPSYTGGSGVVGGATGVVSISGYNVILTVSGSITATQSANGTISPSGTTTVTYGANQTFTITPVTGYSVATLIVDSSSVTPTTSYTFNNVITNHTITATFAINNYTLTYNGGTHGTISGSCDCGLWVLELERRVDDGLAHGYCGGRRHKRDGLLLD